MIRRIRFSISGKSSSESGARQDEVVVEAVVDRRAEAELRARADLEHGLGQHVRQAVTDTVKLAFFGLFVGIHRFDPEASPTRRKFLPGCFATAASPRAWA